MQHGGNYRLAINEKENTKMKLSNTLATFYRNVQTRMSATLIVIMSLAMLTAPARAWNLSADATLYNTAGNQVGKVNLTQEGNGNVAVHVHVHDLPPGFHGFHVHAVGECIAPFTSAGGHFDLDAHTHRDHSGDFPVLLVRADGTANEKFNTDRFAVADLFDTNGSAIIIHADPDNYANIPSRYVAAPDATTLAAGDSGARIACGVLEKTVKRE
ncbi:superoxide dismutase family protein [Herbaspirillum sp. HC18]|nr:superoxide dismutase family protein [Herbaspirillum sp. HC18]